MQMNYASSFHLLFLAGDLKMIAMRWIPNLKQKRTEIIWCIQSGKEDIVFS